MAAPLVPALQGAGYPFLYLALNALLLAAALAGRQAALRAEH